MTERNCNALMALLISLVLWSAFGVQFFAHETPCSLCLLQRLGMLGVAFGALLNVKFGAQKAHYGLSLLSSIFGGSVALRHIALHICKGDSPWKPFWGLNLYTWSLLVFSVAVFYMALLMLIFNRKEDDVKNRRINWFGHFAFFSVGVVALINIFTTLRQCGFGDCE